MKNPQKVKEEALLFGDIRIKKTVGMPCLKHL
jgi:hypothetical protein